MVMVLTTTIRNMDQELRRVIKHIYHLPQCTANGLFYCKKKGGEMGIPKLETISARACLKMGLKFKQCTDPIMRAVFEESKLEKRIGKMARAILIQWPITKLEEIDRYKAREKKGRTEEMGWAKITGKGGLSLQGRQNWKFLAGKSGTT
jgi:hypothetical protein